MSLAVMDEDAVRRLIESITRRIDSGTHVLLREPGRPFQPGVLRLALIQHGQAVPFEVSAVEWREARTAVGRERLARRLGVALGLQPPDQMSGPPHD
jgi:hypothetical protein